MQTDDPDPKLRPTGPPPSKEENYADLTDKIRQKTRSFSTQATGEEKVLSNLESDTFEKERTRAELESYRQDMTERKRYAWFIFLMVSIWLVCIIGIIVLDGLKILEISDGVILGLIGSTTINVTAFFVIVTKYLFPSNQPKN